MGELIAPLWFVAMRYLEVDSRFISGQLAASAGDDRLSRPSPSDGVSFGRAEEWESLFEMARRTFDEAYLSGIGLSTARVYVALQKLYDAAVGCVSDLDELYPWSEQCVGGEISSKSEYVGSELASVASAITTCWSGICELGMDIPASRERPATIPSGDGTCQWSPERLGELKDRLRQRGIDPDMTVTVFSREPHRRPYGGIPRVAPEPYERARRYGAFDYPVSITDAMSDQRHIRSDLAAHSSKGIGLLQLSLFDAGNAEQLLRTVLYCILCPEEAQVASI